MFALQHFICVFSASEGSAYSDESLENPYNIYLTFSDQFLNIPFMKNTITDTHFRKICLLFTFCCKNHSVTVSCFCIDARDRMGRMLSFAARISADYNPGIVHAIGVDEQTALLLDVRTGDVSAVGAGQAYVCSAKQSEQCKDGLPLYYKGKIYY